MSKCEDCEAEAEVDLKIVYEDKTEEYHLICRMCGMKYAEHIFLELQQEDAEFWVKPINTKIWIVTC